jgi:hypothetical protein
MNRTQWLLAYRQSRSLAWGTLWMSHGRLVAELAIAARDFTRAAPVLTAKRFHALGYYARGFRRL